MTTLDSATSKAITAAAASGQPPPGKIKQTLYQKLVGEPPDTLNLLEANNFHVKDELENEAALKNAIRLASIVRSWIKEDAMQSSNRVHNMNRTLIFRETILEKQFCFYYLYVHMVHVRVILLIALVSMIALLIYSTQGGSEEISTRASLFFVLLSAVPLTNRRNVEVGFIFVDWALSLTVFTASISVLMVLRFDALEGQSDSDKYVGERAKRSSRENKK